MRTARIVVLALVAQLLALPAASGMLVLCFGSDGHVALESAGGGACCRDRETGGPEEGSGPAGHLVPSPGPCCQDVDLFIDSATLAVPLHKLAWLAPAPCPSTVHSPCRGTVPDGSFSLEAESPVASSLRTVVLQA